METRVRSCGRREHSGLAWGAIFGKVTKYREMHTFQEWACPKNPERSISGKKGAGGPAAETARSFSKETLPENLPPQNPPTSLSVERESLPLKSSNLNS